MAAPAPGAALSGGEREAHRLADVQRALDRDRIADRFVAATGYGRSRDRVTSMAAGFVDHLVKPVKLDRLREIVALAATAKAARFSARGAE